MFSHQTYNAISEFYKAIIEKNTIKIEESIVIKLIDKILTGKSGPLISQLHKGTILYRAREIDTAKAYNDTDCGFNAYYDESKKFHCSGYNYYESKEPPLSIPSEGRNNIAGMSYLYLSEEPYTACAEIKPNMQGMISLATFKVEKDLEVINLYDKIENYFDWEFLEENEVLPHEILGELLHLYARPNKNDKTYLITQYISDYIRKAGYDGIKYWGSVNYGTNYTIFNSHKSNISFIESKLIAVAGVQYNFYDIEKNKKLPLSGKLPISLDCINIQRGLVRNISIAREGKEQ